MARVALNEILKSQVLHSLAAGVAKSKIALDYGISLATVNKYCYKYKSDIAVMRTTLQKKLAILADEKLPQAFAEIAEKSTGLVNAQLGKYKDENRDFKPGELSYISNISGVAVDKMKVIKDAQENSPSTQSIVFNFTLKKSEDTPKVVKNILDGVTQELTAK